MLSANGVAGTVHIADTYTREIAGRIAVGVPGDGAIVIGTRATAIAITDSIAVPRSVIDGSGRYEHTIGTAADDFLDTLGFTTRTKPHWFVEGVRGFADAFWLLRMVQPMRYSLDDLFQTIFGADDA